ncbi:methyltransferase-domain-containing protein [Rhodocollybia butyracea]|uniref:Ribosomal RNA-processing protein 8 n=1 Tax=Rhodocollybia butyracea TaxID=206335 RepID=A0A9P5UE90_9AGAR|nr:methyltransferase-domain-containing protein [Rhodocollybia butyracea]
MPFKFDVPGWSMSADPVPEAGSRKRKRPTSDTGSETRVHSSEINLEKLVKKLTKKRDEDESRVDAAKSNTGSQSSQSQRKKKKRNQAASAEVDKKSISLPMPLMTSERAAKKAKQSHDARKQASKESLSKQQSASNDNLTVKSNDEPSSGLTSMQKGMKQKLEGARFRLLNQTLYETNSEDAHRMMQEDPTVYSEYHNGFRQQVLSWPTNPVDHYVEMLSSYPAKTVVVDLGCGDAAIARALIPKGLSVLSFDLVSNNPYVVEADICGTLPLPGSEGSEGSISDGEAHIVDVVVFSLSLMSTNWPQSIRDAWRVLKPNGELKIAEVTSRFLDIETFVSLVSSIGFKLKSKDERNTHFTLFEFKKVSRKFKSQKEWDDISSQADTLKPCEYKRRCK